MKQTIRLILVIVSLFSAIHSFAQVKFGAIAGINFSNTTAFSSLSTPVKSFHAGGILEFQLSKRLGLESGLMISGKGFQWEAVIIDVNGTHMETFNEHFELLPYYLELPVNVTYRFDLKFARLRIFAGFYMGRAVFGKYKADDPPFAITSPTLYNYGTRNIKFGSNEDCDLKKIDMGSNVGAGFEVYKFQFRVQYSLSIKDLNPNKEYHLRMPMVIKNAVAGLSIAYMF